MRDFARRRLIVLAVFAFEDRIGSVTRHRCGLRIVRTPLRLDALLEALDASPSLFGTPLPDNVGIQLDRPVFTRLTSEASRSWIDRPMSPRT